MSRWEQRLVELGLTLPERPERLGLYAPGVRVGDLLFLSGQTPQQGGRTVVCGQVGRDVDVRAAAEGARLAALNALAQARFVLGSLDKILRIVRVTGYVVAVETFADHPQVVDGASRLFTEIFGEHGLAARSALGVASLPQSASVELDVVLQVADDVR